MTTATKTSKKYYHVFWDNGDDWHTNYRDAIKQVHRLQREERENIRLYEEYEEIKEGEPTGNFTDGDILFSQGNFPL